MGIFKEIWEFLKARRKLWLGPIIIMLIGLGLLMALTAGSTVSSIIYVLF
jgi:hypothetical protein